ncbi:hypothetical protein VIBNISFn118_1460007 [Vibrio nigripulchritudo SFn118]|nr:hypothetical protein VIBNISFn118_1460007 [Vibrio nigripulchritudo SFn118]
MGSARIAQGHLDILALILYFNSLKVNATFILKTSKIREPHETDP